MSVPAGETAHFVVVQAQIFGVFKIFLNMPPGATGLHHLLQRGALWGEHQVIALLLRISETAADEEEVAPISFPAMQDGYGLPVKEPGTFGALTHRETLPILLTEQEGFRCTHFHQ